MGEAIEASNVEIENSFTLDTFKKDVVEVLSNYSGLDSAHSSKGQIRKNNSLERDSIE
jgi:hypothetical protein